MCHWIRAALVIVLLVGVISLPAGGSIHAQGGGSLGYGSKVFGKILGDTPTVIYSFSGSTGDLVQVRVRNWVGTLDPRVDLVGPDGQTIASSLDDPFAEDPLEASLALVLPQTGVFMLLVSGENGTTGEFLLKLQGRGIVPAIPLMAGQPVDVTIPPNPTPQFFVFEAQTCPTVLTIANLSEGQPFTFPFVVKVRNAQGHEIAQFYGGDALEDRVIVPPSSGRYEVEVGSDDPLAQGTVRLTVSCADQAPGCVPGSAGIAGAADVGGCPSCFSDDFEGGPCAAFEIAVTLDGGTASFTWPSVEGADHYIFSIIDASRALLMDSPILLEGETSHSYIFNPADLLRGPFTAYVTAGSEIEGLLCADDAPVSFSGQTTAECMGISVGADIVPGAERMAVASWSAAPGAAAYLIHVYAVGDDSGLIGIRVLTVPGDATTYHLSGVFPADYTRFQIEVAAYSAATGGGAFGDMPQGYLCSGSASLEFEPTGPVEWGAAAGI
jgi:hypothetical protein